MNEQEIKNLEKAEQESIKDFLIWLNEPTITRWNKIRDDDAFFDKRDMETILHIAVKKGYDLGKNDSKC